LLANIYKIFESVHKIQRDIINVDRRVISSSPND